MKQTMLPLLLQALLILLGFQAFISRSLMVYHGVVKEDAKVGQKVDLDKPLYIRNMSGFLGEVCGYTIHGAFSDLPFRIVLLESFSGGASIVVDGKLDYEQQQSYNFQLSAHDCRDPVNMTNSEREKVEISIEDVNDNAPRWVDSSYSVSVGNLLRRRQQLVCLQITDDDISKKFSDVCRFTLLDQSERFYIDEKGCLYNKEVLVGLASSRVTHILKVYAQDCGGLMTDGVEVRVEWEPTCTYSWRGYDRNIDLSEFSGNSTSLPLFKSVEFDACDENDSCAVDGLSVALKLSSPMDGGCRMDRESLTAQRAFCGLVEEPTTLFLLQNETSFSGNSIILEIPPEELQQHLEGHFLVSVWMRREKIRSEEREQILCYSDDSKVTRRHSMWYIEGCRMSFVLRRTGRNGDEEKVQSQWEWNVPELCSGGWHHYALASASQEMFSVDLYVDGRMFTSSKSDPRITRKWKLHPLSHPPPSKVVIGACWMGRHERMEEVFHGQLSGLTLSSNHTDMDQVVKCLSQCHERLTLEKIDDIQTGTFVLLSEDKTHLIINSSSPDSLRDVLREVDLLLPSPRPLLGSRIISISTDIICKNSERLSFDSNDLEVVISKPRPLRISTNHLMPVDEVSLMGGVKIMEAFQIKEVTGQVQVHLESCFVRSDSPMDLSTEMFLFDGDLLRELDLQVDLNNRGLFVGQVEESMASLKSYEQFMRSLRYSNKIGSYWQRRSFTVGCLGPNEELLTNHARVLLQLVATRPELPPLPDNMGRGNLLVDQPVIKKSSLASDKDDATNLGFWLPIFLVVSVGVIITLGVLGVSKLREKRSEQHAADMEWDNSEMSIAVNPLYEMDDLNSMDRSEIFDEDDNGCDDGEDDDDDDYVAGEAGNNEEARRDLEWDDLPY